MLSMPRHRKRGKHSYWERTFLWNALSCAGFAQHSERLWSTKCRGEMSSLSQNAHLPSITALLSGMQNHTSARTWMTSCRFHSYLSLSLAPHFGNVHGNGCVTDNDELKSPVRLLRDRPRSCADGPIASGDGSSFMRGNDVWWNERLLGTFDRAPME